MKAIRIYAYGGPEQLRYEEAPMPAPKAGEILVRVRASSVNPWDYNLASGALKNAVRVEFPYVPGGEFSGIIERVGPGVSYGNPGFGVFGNCPRGASAHFVPPPAESLAPRPASLTDIQAA